MAGELTEKLERLRRLLASNDMDAACLTQAGNVSWLLCGGDPLVSLTDPPVAQIMVTVDEARVLLPEFERDRFEAEEMPEGLTAVYLPWEDPGSTASARRAWADPERTIADGPVEGARQHDFWPQRVPMHQDEVSRYRQLGREAATAVGDVLRTVEPGINEQEVSALVAGALRRQGIVPALVLVAGDARLKRFRHPLPKDLPANDRLMVVVCARRHGLYANFTRLVAFTPLEAQEQSRYESLLEVEAAAFARTRHGRSYREILAAIQQAYADQGQGMAWKHHHQGGPTGYYSRDFLATVSEDRQVVDGQAHAWNPSLPGLKVEDTVLLQGGSLEVLTVDPEWPTTNKEGLMRPRVLVKG